MASRRPNNGPTLSPATRPRTSSQDERADVQWRRKRDRAALLEAIRQAELRGDQGAALAASIELSKL